MKALLSTRRLVPLSVLLLAIACGKDSPAPSDDSAPTGRQPEGPLAGQRVAASADLTGDGLPDVLISAPGLEQEGRVLVFDGSLTGAQQASAATATIQATEPGQVGEGLAACGDVDGDGTADLLVGLPAGNSARGGAWLIAGPVSGTLDPEDHPLVRGTDPDAAAGYHVACDGDLDGDGRMDIAMTAPFADGMGVAKEAGQVFFHHVVDAEPEPFASAGSTYDQEWLGHERSLVLRTDIDGDGLNDALIGGPGKSRIHILIAPITGTINAQNSSGKLEGREDDDRFGHAIVTGDLDGDGYDDVVGSAPDFGPQSGAIGIVNGPIAPDVDDRVENLGRWIDGQDPREYAGTALAIASDLSGDGNADLLVGSPGAVTSGPEAGVVYAVFGPAETATLATADRVIVGTVEYARFGASLAAVPDVNGDGLDEVLVGAPGLDVGDRIGVGGAWIFQSPLPDRQEQADATTAFGF